MPNYYARGDRGFTGPARPAVLPRGERFVHIADAETELLTALMTPFAAPLSNSAKRRTSSPFRFVRTKCSLATS